MSDKPTPGPWSVCYAPNLTAIVTPKGAMKISMPGKSDGLQPLACDLQEWQANVKQMAAVPDLVAALRQVICIMSESEWAEYAPITHAQILDSLAKAGY